MQSHIPSVESSTVPGSDRYDSSEVLEHSKTCLLPLKTFQLLIDTILHILLSRKEFYLLEGAFWLIWFHLENLQRLLVFIFFVVAFRKSLSIVMEQLME